MLFGDGKILLLESVEKYGSVLKAAEALNMDYLKARDHIQRIEALFSAKITERHGRGSRLTKRGRELVKAYNMLSEAVWCFSNSKYKERFFPHGEPLMPQKTDNTQRDVPLQKPGTAQK